MTALQYQQYQDQMTDINTAKRSKWYSKPSNVVYPSSIRSFYNPHTEYSKEELNIFLPDYTGLD